jgi:hypothetical protein
MSWVRIPSLAPIFSPSDPHFAERACLPSLSHLSLPFQADKPKEKPFKDQRSSAARDIRRSWSQSKHELFRNILKRALEFGYAATFLLADAWFGCKENIALALQSNLFQPNWRGFPKT